MRHGTKNEMILVLIRHGETAANRERRYLGKTDEGLCEQGRTALMTRRAQNVYPEAAYLFCSPMKRCRESAAFLYPKMEPVFIPEWEEMDFGAFEYKNYEELKEDERYQAWIDSGGIMAFPGGESREQFVLRCEKGFLRMCSTLCDMTEKGTQDVISAAAVVHGGTIMALLSLYGGKPYFDWQTACGGGYLCRIRGFREGGCGKRDAIKAEVLEEI